MFQQSHTTAEFRQTTSWENHVGDVVEILRADQVVRGGVVEEEMPHRSGLWFAADATDRRQYFHKDPGYGLWL